MGKGRHGWRKFGGQGGIEGRDRYRPAQPRTSCTRHSQIRCWLPHSALAQSPPSLGAPLPGHSVRSTATWAQCKEQSSSQDGRQQQGQVELHHGGKGSWDSTMRERALQDRLAGNHVIGRRPRQGVLQMAMARRPRHIQTRHTTPLWGSLYVGLCECGTLCMWDSVYVGIQPWHAQQPPQTAASGLLPLPQTRPR